MFGLSTLKLIGLGAVLAAVLGLYAVWTIRGSELTKARAQLRLDDAQVASLTAAAEHATKVQVVSNTVDTKNTAAQVQIKTVTQTIIEKVPVYVTPEADARCILPVGFVRLFNAAATGSSPDAVPAPPGLADSAPSGVECSVVASTVADNFGKYRSVAAQLNAHIDWDEQQEVLAP